MTTKLEKPIRREVVINERAYTLTIDPAGLKLVEKGHRKGRELQWQELLGARSGGEVSSSSYGAQD